MKHKFVLVSALIFATSGVVTMAQGGNFVYFDELCVNTINTDTKVKKGKPFNIIDGDCTIQVNNAKLEIVGVIIKINGELEIKDITMEGEGAAELIIKNAKIKTGDRLRIEDAWDGGVTFKNNWVDTGDDLRVKPIGSGGLIFKNNWGQVVDDLRLGDVIKDQGNIVGGLDGDIDVRNNKIRMIAKPVEDPEEPDLTEFVVQSFDGDIDVRNNNLRDNVARIDITSSGSGDTSVKNNRFINNQTTQEIIITSEDGDVRVLNNRFGKEGIGEVDINSTEGQCKSKRNRPELLNDNEFVCQNSNP